MLEQRARRGAPQTGPRRPARVSPADYTGSGVLFNKVALISGGDAGIGRAAAVLCAREGAEIAIVFAKDEQEDAERTAEAVAAEGRKVLLLPGDVRSSAFCKRVVKKTIARFGHLDILVNNAAYQKPRGSIGEIDDRQLKRTVETNIYGQFFMARAALEHMREGASIVNVGSLSGLEGSAQLLDYSATTGAIHAFTKSLAANLADRGIRVNAIAPGPGGTPEQIAPSIVFFASPIHSSYITGEVLALLGGDPAPA
jgi:NAD(P)-dependent dehydrogenase (short-subunit alcohol dehydrogenase family)